MINLENVCDNICNWDGNLDIWQPPAGYTMLVRSETPAIIWMLDDQLQPPDWVLTEQMGEGQIGFTWDGKVLTTNQPKPEPPTPIVNPPTI